MKHVLVVLTALIAGAVGGGIGTYAVLAHTRGRAESVIRAHRFELIDEAGKTDSFWGRDMAGSEVLAFQGQADGVSGNRNQQLAIGFQGKGERPFLCFYGSDGHIRVLLDFDDFQRPSLWMSDGRELGLTLGSARSDTPAIRDKTERWVLNFIPEDTTRVGTVTEQVGSQNYVHGFSFINPKGIKYPR